MGGRSGERNRRIALGIVPGKSGGEAATLRYSVNDRAKRPLPPILSGRSAPVKPVGKAPVAICRDAEQLRAALRRELKRAESSVEAARVALKETPRDPLMITDHAVLRFLERVMGVDVNSIRSQIARVIPPAALELDRAVYVRDGVAYLVATGSLVTVLDESLDNDLQIAFSVDGIAPASVLAAPNEGDLRNNVRRAAKLLSRRAHEPARKAKADMAAKLRDELAAGMVCGRVAR